MYAPPFSYSDGNISEVDQSFIEMGWVEKSCVLDDESCVTCASFHDSCELLWVGNEAGRLTSYSSSPMHGSASEKYSSFKAADDPIFEILPFDKAVASLTSSSIRFHSLGGLPLSRIDNPYPEDSCQFTCMHLFRNFGESFYNVPSGIIAGTNTSSLNIFSEMRNDSPVMEFNVEAPTVRIQSNDSYIAVAGNDGNVRLLDGRLRTQHIIHTLPSHSGSILDMVLDKDEFLLATCGMSGRAINPYDPNSPFIYNADATVKLFDLRMPAAVSPITTLAIMPSLVRFLPSALDFLKAQPSVAQSTSSVVCMSADGYFQTCSMDYDGNFLEDSGPVMTSICSLELGELTSAAVSSSGRMMAFGSSGGAIVQMFLQHVITEEEEANSIDSTTGAPTLYAGNILEPIMTLDAEPLDIPAVPLPPVPRSVLVNDAILGTSYILCKRPDTLDAPLLSSYATTPRQAKTRLRIPMTRRISNEIMSSAVFQEFIGSVPNPGFLVNSMIYGPSRRDAYQTCDPRIVDTATVIDDIENGTDGYQGSGKSIPPKYRLTLSHRGKNKMKAFNYHAHNTVGIQFVGLENSIPRPWINPFLQLLYAIPKIHDAALTSQIRSFHHIQATYSMWCELGLIFHTMALISQHAQDGLSGTAIPVASASSFHTVFLHSSGAAAIGLLKDVLSARNIGSSGEVKSLGSAEAPSPVYTPNTVPGAAPTASLTNESYGLRLQQVLQLFSRFVLQQLSKENEQEMKLTGSAATNQSRQANSLSTPATSQGASKSRAGLGYTAEDPIEELFGITVNTLTTFLISQSLDSSTYKTLSLEMAYIPGIFGGIKAALAVKNDAGTLSNFIRPSLAAYPHSVSVRSKWTLDNPVSRPSFSAVMWTTMIKETQMKGWCSASESYEPFRQVKSVVVRDLPQLLMLQCGDTLPSVLSTPVSPTAGSSSLGDTVNKERSAIAELWRSHNITNSGPWMSTEVEVFSVPSSIIMGGETASQSSSNITFISEKLRTSVSSSSPSPRNKSHRTASGSGVTPELRRTPSAGGSEQQYEWLIFNGSSYISSSCPASTLIRDAYSRRSDGSNGPSKQRNAAEIGECVTYDLFAVISQIDDQFGQSSKRSSSSSDDASCHAILHMNKHILSSSNSSTGPPSTPTSDGKGNHSVENHHSPWILFNDFVVAPSDDIEATSFTEWRHPGVLVFAKRDGVKHTAFEKIDMGSGPRSPDAKNVSVAPREMKKLPLIPEAALSLPSLSSVPTGRHISLSFLPKGDFIQRMLSTSTTTEISTAPLIAFDAEFVTVETDEVHLDTQGKQVVGREGRQVVARISLLGEASSLLGKHRTDPTAIAAVKSNLINSLNIPVLDVSKSSANSASGPRDVHPEVLSKLSADLPVPLVLLCDDYVLPPEPVVDYVTRFSGLTSDDLTPSISKHVVISHRSAVLKLRYYVDSGCIFVGHGLNKDFETANIYVPPEQIRDTVELWRIPNQRKISLRFLAAYLLKSDIQDELHDSIEDAKTAYALYLLYQKVYVLYGVEGISAVLRDLYAYGNANNWTLGLDRIRPK